MVGRQKGRDEKIGRSNKNWIYRLECRRREYCWMREIEKDRNLLLVHVCVGICAAWGLL